MANKDLNQKLSKVLKEILSNKYIELNAKNEKDLTLEIDKLIAGVNEVIDSKSLNLDYNEEYFMFFYIPINSTMLTNLEEKLKTNIASLLNTTGTNYKSFNFIFIVNQLCNKLTLEKKITTNGFKKNCLTLIKSQINNTTLKLSDIEYTTIFIGDQKPQDFEIKINSRIRSLEMSPSSANQVSSFTGYVFSANLFDIVEIYNALGNELFDKNVRYGINDELQVQYEIKKTLEKNPEEFWYLNNGITIVIKDTDFKLNKSNSLLLKYGNEKVLYVINGAQTISAAAEFFYSIHSTDEIAAAITAAQAKAQVMLRIIEVTQTPPTEEDKEIDKISISLNRQKPIKVEDIAFTMPFVYSINKLNQTHKDEFDYFRLIKRGETSSNSYEYNLVQFARAAKAYLAQEPGKAMSQGARTLLKPTYKDETTLFSDDTIFKQDIISEEGENYDRFKKYYTPINLAIKLEKSYSSFAKSHNEYNGLQLAILNYGKWHFVAYMIYILNNNDVSDFSNLKVDEGKLTANIDQCISHYVELFAKVASTNTKYTSLSTNDFKGTDLYNYFRNYPTSNDALEDINILIKDFSEYTKTLLI